MKKSSTLAHTILNDEIAPVTEDLGHRLNVIIDSMTDDNCQPLPHADKALVAELKAIAYKLYQLNDEILSEASEELVATIEAGW